MSEGLIAGIVHTEFADIVFDLRKIGIARVQETTPANELIAADFAADRANFARRSVPANPNIAELYGRFIAELACNFRLG